MVRGGASGTLSPQLPLLVAEAGHSWWLNLGGHGAGVRGVHSVHGVELMTRPSGQR